ncbi:hypothetical protein NDU88_004750 [Pleurodeles waltl]|uniref:Uncharacterized protein n=1 Tax=Pleurodeles waltl TaxID=8319 RepID=A0AAV7QIR2_PLEWA|nr:hypothetical protein NDU88_004750 [Pleurodeles waltl]
MLDSTPIPQSKKVAAVSSDPGLGALEEGPKRKAPHKFRFRFSAFRNDVAGSRIYRMICDSEQTRERKRGEEITREQRTRGVEARSGRRGTLVISLPLYSIFNNKKSLLKQRRSKGLSF